MRLAEVRRRGRTMTRSKTRQAPGAAKTNGSNREEYDRPWDNLSNTHLSQKTNLSDARQTLRRVAEQYSRPAKDGLTADNVHRLRKCPPRCLSYGHIEQQRKPVRCG